MPSDYMTQMKQVHMPQGVAHTWDQFQKSWFSSVDFLLYLFVAILFFSLGRSFTQLQTKMIERAQRNGFGGYQTKYSKIPKLKSEEPDEEKLSSADEVDHE